MKWLKLPTAEGKPLWGGIFWYLPCVYVFSDPYQRHAGWFEWTLTGIGFAIFFCLYLLGLVYWSKRKVLQAVCIATFVLAVAFTAYRPMFGIFFAFVAAFGPFTVNGNIPLSLTIVFIAAIAHILESWLMRGSAYLVFAVVIGAESLMIGAGTMFAARQQKSVERALKVAERERIARDLHDILGHTLSVVILKSELAGKLLARDPERARVEIANVESIARKALAEVREAIHGYHAGDLQAEFERVELMLKAVGVAVEVEYEKCTVPAIHERILIFALKEAATNIMRHAQAKHCRIQLRKIEGAYRLAVSDDGVGVSNDEGLGIRGMRQRVESIGGSLSLSSASGTELIVSLPASSAI
jgi:two-component system sensor histidine kinase DesK